MRKPISQMPRWVVALLAAAGLLAGATACSMDQVKENGSKANDAVKSRLSPKPLERPRVPRNATYVDIDGVQIAQSQDGVPCATANATATYSTTGSKVIRYWVASKEVEPANSLIVFKDGDASNPPTGFDVSGDVTLVYGGKAVWGGGRRDVYMNYLGDLRGMPPAPDKISTQLKSFTVCGYSQSHDPGQQGQGQ